jgi:calcium/calmodulin-dependent protein kinase I
MGNSLNLCPTDLYGDEPFDQVWEVDEANSIGSGKFSTVHHCWRHNDPDTRYALKVISTKMGDVCAMGRIKEEIEILQVLGNHPGIITLVDVDESLPSCIRLVMDLCEGGELYDRIQAKKHYPEPEAKAAVRNLIEACAYIHSKGIMHRDLKPENILLSSKTSSTEIKISDFGLAKMSRDYPRRLPRSHSICGSDFYLAPEVIKQEEYGREIDIWAIGVITYVILSGSLPFFHQVLHKLYRQIVERDLSFPEEAWRNVSKGALDFILRLLQVRAGDRLTADQALNHPWLRNASGSSSFGGSFRDLTGIAGSNAPAPVLPRQISNTSVNTVTTDLQKVLSKCTSNAHPLVQSHKVNNEKAESNGSASTTTSAMNLKVGPLFGAPPPLGAPQLTATAMPGTLLPPAYVGAMQVQSRAQPPMFR